MKGNDFVAPAFLFYPEAIDKTEIRSKILISDLLQTFQVLASGQWATEDCITFLQADQSYHDQEKFCG